MNTQQFIFSNRLHHRIARHVVFWTLFWVSWQYTYLIPTSYLPQWQVHNTPPLLERLGWFKFLLFVLVNSSKALLLQVLFTYTLIYYLLPNYLLREKYRAFFTGVVLISVVSIILWTYMAYYSHGAICKVFGVKPKNPTLSYLFGCYTEGFLFFFPTVGAVAVGIKLMKYWYRKQIEAQQLILSKANAELQLLRAQVHPHFLFNTLNNIYSFILTSSPQGPGMLKKLSGLLHYIIYECNQPLVPLEKEIKMIRDYISLETVRYGEQFDITLDIRGEYQHLRIAPLLLLPFVENSFKHGTSKMLSHSWMSLNIIIEEEDLYLMLNNSKPQEYVQPAGNGGIGLVNVQKRLQLLYPGRHELTITSEPEHYTVLLYIDLKPGSEISNSQKFKKRQPLIWDGMI